MCVLLFFVDPRLIWPDLVKQLLVGTIYSFGREIFSFREVFKSKTLFQKWWPFLFKRAKLDLRLTMVYMLALVMKKSNNVEQHLIA